MDRILHERGAQLVVGAAVEEIFLRRIFSGTERSKLENNPFSAKSTFSDAAGASVNYKSER